MKKLSLLLVCTCLLLLSACQRPSAEELSSPTPSLTAETSPVSPSPAVSSPTDSDPTPLPSAEKIELPRFLEEFSFTKAEAQVPEGGVIEYITCQLTPEELTALKSAAAVDTWWEATNIPAMGLEGMNTLYDDEGHTLIIANWDEEKCLIVAKGSGDDDFIALYHAPIAVLEDLNACFASLPLLPAFLHDFEMDRIMIDRDPYEDGEGYENFDLYLLDDAKQGSLLTALEPDTWTVIWDSNEVAVSWEAALELQDAIGDRMVLVPWDEEKCLVNCFYENGMSVVRYWAPASVLEKVQDLADDLSPLGTVSYEVKRYFDLFWSDPGFSMVVRDADKQGTISDDMMAAYVFYVTDYTYEVGIPPKTVDAVTQKYFGRKMESYDTGWSDILPSGNMTPSGWDFHFGCYPILDGTPTIKGDGSITATFQVYLLSEHLWLDEKLPAFQLRHTKEYLLTGHDKDYLADEWSSVSTIEITFHIETDHKYGTEREYAVYDAVKLVD